MEHLIKLGYVFIGVWALISIVGIVVFYIIANNLKKERDKRYEEFRKGHKAFEREWTRHGR